MSRVSLLGRVVKTDSKWYLALGVLSLLKAVGVRHDRRRLRRELLDAGTFLALGLLRRQVEKRTKKAGGKRTALRRSVEKRAKSGGSGDSLFERVERQTRPPARTKAESKVDSLKRRLSLA